MAVNHKGPRGLATCESCGVVDRYWKRIEIRWDGAMFMDVKLCRRCASAVVDGAGQIVRERQAV